MAKFVPPSIESFGGIQAFLDASKENHNGYGYDDLIRNRPGKKDGKLTGLNITNLGRMFGVSRPTIQSWLMHVDVELENNKRSVAKTGRARNNT